MLKASSVLAVFTLLSRILGLVRESVRAALLGTSALGDAFTVAFMLPDFFRRLAADGVLTSSFVPAFKCLIANGGREEIRDFLSGVFSLACFVFFGLTLIGMLSSDLLSALFAPSLEADAAVESSVLIRIMLPYLAFITVGTLIQGVLNCIGVFKPSGFAPVIFNVTVIASALLLSPFTVNPARALAAGVLFGGFFQLLFQLPFFLKTAFRFSVTGLGKALSNPAVKRLCAVFLPAAVGVGAYQINILVSTRIANRAGVGVVSSLQFSTRIEDLILGIFVVSLSTVILPELVSEAKSGNSEEFEKKAQVAMKLVSFISIPAIMFTIFFATEMVELLFGFGSFGSESVSMTAYALKFHIVGLFFVAAAKILNPLFFAKERILFPVAAGCTSIVVNLIFSLLLVDRMKGGGIALASTVAATAATAVLLAGLGQHLKTTGGWLLYSLKITIISAICVSPVLFLRSPLQGLFSAYQGSKAVQIILFGIPASIFVLLFAGFSFAAKDETLKLVLRLGKKRDFME